MEWEERPVFKGKVCYLLLLVFCLSGFSLAAGNEGVRTIQQENAEDGYAVYYKVNLHLGTRGEDVRLLQRYLTRLGYFRGEADGIFGITTRQAVKEFQYAAGLTVDGIAGPQTFRALRQDDGQYVSRGMGQRTAEMDRYAETGMAGDRANSPDTIPSAWRPIQLEATAYTRYDAGCTNWTYRGNYLQHGLVAVDPRIIPLGTRLYVPGYGFAIADDIGRAIKGHKIDLAMETRVEAFTYGRRQITAYIIDWDQT